MTMKISDELREWCDDAYSGKKIRTTKDLYAIADLIDREMVELPKDADGVPIHVGDTVYDGNGMAREVVSISFGRCGGGMTVHAVDGSSKWCDLIPGNLAHAYPDSFERIADELEELSESNRINGSGEVFYRAGDLAARIRRLADKEAER
ncbi:MAG: hypothetical protein SO366_02950 [Atopobiaceae bacterium]|nr:hypothetical protein [Atopobiaceae bacterium]